MSKNNEVVVRLNNSSILVKNDTELKDNIDVNAFIVEEIGRGGYGTVYKVKCKQKTNKTTKATSEYTQLLQGSSNFVETFNVATYSDQCAMKRVTPDENGIISPLELYIMTNIDHPHLAGSYGVNIDHNRNCNILQPLARGDFSTLIRRPNKRIHYNVARTWAWQLCTATAALHSRGIIHGDIKGSNALIFSPPDDYSFENSVIKLADFSLSFFMHNPHAGRTKMSYTEEYRPIEVWQKLPWSYPSDIWALGVTLYELLYSKKLFESKDKNHIEIHENWAMLEVSPSTGIVDTFKPLNESGKRHKFNLHPDWSIGTYRLFNDLILNMLSPDPFKRLTIWEVLDHPLFDDFKNDLLLPKITHRGYPHLKLNVSPIFTLYEGLCNKEVLSIASLIYESALEKGITTEKVVFVIIAYKIIAQRIPPEVSKTLINKKVLECEVEIYNKLNFNLIELPRKRIQYFSTSLSPVEPVRGTTIRSHL